MSARPTLLDIPAVAEDLSVSPDYVYAEIAAGRLSTIDISNGRVRSKMRVHRDEVDRWIAARRERAG